MKILILFFTIATNIQAMEFGQPVQTHKKGGYQSFPPSQEQENKEQENDKKTELTNLVPPPENQVIMQFGETSPEPEKCSWKGWACGCCALCLLCSAAALAAYYCPGIVIK